MNNCSSTPALHKTGMAKVEVKRVNVRNTAFKKSRVEVSLPHHSSYYCEVFINRKAPEH